MNNYTTHLHNQLLKNRGIISYLEHRGLTLKTIKKFQIGLALSKKEELPYLLENKDYHIQMGNLKINDEGVFEPTFSNRVVIPLANDKGEIVGFTGRTISDIAGRFLNHNQKNFGDFINKKKYKIAKYLNTIETKYFKKSNILFNSHRVKTRYCWIVEAQLSAIGVHQTVNQSVMATGGTAFTESHLALLKQKGITDVCLALDPDKAGYNATYKTAMMLINANFRVMVAVLPKGSDPMDMIQANEVKELEEILYNPRTGVKFLVDYFNHQHKNLSKFKYIQEVEKFFNQVNIKNANTLIANPKPKSIGWFINRAMGVKNER